MQYLYGFFGSEAAKETKFYNAGLAGMLLGEAVQGVMDRQHIHVQRRIVGRRIDPHTVGESAALQSTAFAREIHQYIAHDPGCDIQEMGSAFPVDFLDGGEAEVEFVNQNGRLDGLVGGVPGEDGAGKASQFGVKVFGKAIKCSCVSLSPLVQKPGDEP